MEIYLWPEIIRFIICKSPTVLCINLGMFSECKITLNFFFVILGFNYSTSKKSADNWCHLNFLPINHVLHQAAPLNKMLVLKIIDVTAVLCFIV